MYGHACHQQIFFTRYIFTSLHLRQWLMMTDNFFKLHSKEKMIPKTLLEAMSLKQNYNTSFNWMAYM